MRSPAGSMTHRLIVTWFDCRTTCRMTERPTPMITEYCNGMTMVSANVVASTVTAITTLAITRD